MLSAGWLTTLLGVVAAVRQVQGRADQVREAQTLLQPTSSAAPPAASSRLQADMHVC